MKRLFILAALLSGLFTFVPVVNAGQQGTACPSDPTRVLLWENATNDSSDGNDTYWKCSDDSDLNSGDDHTLPGNCNNGLIGGTGNWNDCVSAVTAYIPSGWKLCIYQNAGYSNPTQVWIASSNNGVHINLSSDMRDQLSSFRWRTNAQSC